MMKQDTADKPLLARLQALEKENALLKQRVAILEGTPVLSQGIRGERLISEMLDGKMTVHTTSHDVELKDGTTLEVKFSRLTVPMPNCNTKRWNWCYPLGSRFTKVYDRLLLVAEADPRYLEQYADPESPYVFFDIPFDEIGAIKGSENWIGLTTNPCSKRKSRRQVLFEQYQVTRTILKERYGLSVDNK